LEILEEHREHEAAQLAFALAALEDYNKSTKKREGVET
jgi:hypothetical protein